MSQRRSLERLVRRCSLKMFSCLMPLFPVMIFPTTSSSSISTWVSASSSSVSSSCSNSSTLSLCLLSCSSWAVSTLFYRSAISSYLLLSINDFLIQIIEIEWNEDTTSEDQDLFDVSNRYIAIGVSMIMIMMSGLLLLLCHQKQRVSHSDHNLWYQLWTGTNAFYWQHQFLAWWNMNRTGLVQDKSKHVQV